MSFFTRQSLVAAAIEPAYAQDAAPTGADAIQVSDLSIQMQADQIDRDLIRPFLGAAEQLVGTRRVEMQMTVELAGSGVAATPPAWGPLLRACGLAETIDVTPGQERVEYTPVSDSFDSVTIYWYGGGVIHKMLGARGTAEINMTIGTRPTMRLTMTGIDGGVAEAPLPAGDFSAWKKPVPVTSASGASILLDPTFNAGALAGGIAEVSRGLALNLGNEVQHVPLLGGEQVIIGQRAASGQVTLDLTAARRAGLYQDLIANLTHAIGFSVGVGAGATIVTFAPAVQLINPRNVDQDGLLLQQYDLRLTPQAGNDEFTIIAR